MLGQYRVEDVGRHLVEPAVGQHSGGVHHDVDTVEPGARSVEQGAHLGGVPDVGGYDDHAGAVGSAVASHLVQGFRRT